VKCGPNDPCSASVYAVLSLLAWLTCLPDQDDRVILCSTEMVGLFCLSTKVVGLFAMHSTIIGR
jgi:hypothetical protein